MTATNIIRSTTIFTGTRTLPIPTSSYGRALAQTAGTAMMRLADADLIPVDYSPQAEAIGKYETELEKLLKDKQDEFTERNLELQEGVFKATADPRNHPCRRRLKLFRPI